VVRALVAADSNDCGPHRACCAPGGHMSAGWHTDLIAPHTTPHHTVGCFHHATLFYTGEDGFLEGTVPFIREAVAAEEPILLAVSPSKIDALQQALGDDADRVRFADMHSLGRNPARIIPAWRRFLRENAADDRPVRGVGEPVWAGRSDAELSECQRHEALLNVAFDGGRAWRLLCPYDLDALDEEVIDAARRSHPFLEQQGRSDISEGYVPSHCGSGFFEDALAPPITPPHELTFTGEQLASVRRFVSQAASGASLDGARSEDLVLAMNELATNSVRHGGGAGTVRVWTEKDTLLCEVGDRGHITEPLIGRTPPTPGQRSGRGLWVVNHLCDLVQIHSTPAGSRVRVHMRLI
jgi:anti-sigma regulatory factor (Ser/Thr protein kinase)